MKINPQQIQQNNLSNSIHQTGSSHEAQTAKEFEAMFLQMMLKEMHPKIESGGILGASKSEDMFHQIMDEAIAKDMVDSGQSKLGLQEALTREYFNK